VKAWPEPNPGSPCSAAMPLLSLIPAANASRVFASTVPFGRASTSFIHVAFCMCFGDECGEIQLRRVTVGCESFVDVIKYVVVIQPVPRQSLPHCRARVWREKRRCGWAQVRGLVDRIGRRERFGVCLRPATLPIGDSTTRRPSIASGEAHRICVQGRGDQPGSRVLWNRANRAARDCAPTM
jgi:hypothetical protein